MSDKPSNIGWNKTLSEIPLAPWLQQQTTRLCEQILDDLPNVLPDGKDVDDFLRMVSLSLGQPIAEQLYQVQVWAVRVFGADSELAMDWLLILRVLKEKLFQRLIDNFGTEGMAGYWPKVDRIVTYALIETAKLTGGNSEEALILEHMVNLRRQMEELDRTKSHFIQVAAHELRTPLTLLEGYTNMLREEALAEEPLVQMYIAGLDGGTNRLREIIGDMIDLSMIESGIIQITHQEIYLEQMVRQVSDSIRRTFEHRRVTLVVESFALPHAMYGDPERLSQVFKKIIGNGLKYTPDGGTVTVRAEQVRHDEATADIANYIDVQVQDTGIGIASEHLESIFESFGGTGDVKLHSSGKTKFKGGGPGLGLPIARGIVEAHGGRIWAESEGFDERKLSGSTFHIELPYRTAPPQLGEKG